MQDSTTSLIDMRWNKEGWRDACRLRLTGWLPNNLAEEGIKIGLWERHTNQPRGQVVLAEYGRWLTDVPDFALDKYNLEIVAFALWAKGYDPAWQLAPIGVDHVVLPADEQFGTAYRCKLYAELCRGIAE